jgi:hypothetical protein
MVGILLELAIQTALWPPYSFLLKVSRARKEKKGKESVCPAHNS